MNINRKTDALIIIDMQNDFCPGGALAVNGGDEIIDGIVDLAKHFDHIILSQDWHPKSHSSFASTHAKNPYDEVDMPYGKQTLWPDHCVQGTKGADFHPKLENSDVLNKSSMIIRKGMNIDIDSYSAFYENDRQTKTGLAGFLNDKDIKRVFIVGLAYDFCVAYSALDAIKEGFDAVVVKDLCRAIAIPVENNKTTVDIMEENFQKDGVILTNLQTIQSKPDKNTPKLFHFNIMRN